MAYISSNDKTYGGGEKQGEGEGEKGQGKLSPVAR